jgi:hypothetical protein
LPVDCAALTCCPAAGGLLGRVPAWLLWQEGSLMPGMPDGRAHADGVAWCCADPGRLRLQPRADKR